MAAKLNIRVQVDTSGAREALRAFRANVQQRVLKKAVGRAVKPVAKAAKQAAPKGPTGLLRKSIGSKVKVYPRRGVVVGIVGPRTGFRTVVDGRPVDPTKYAHLAEGGRQSVTAKKARMLAGRTRKGLAFFGQRVAAAVGRRFMKRAWDQSQGQARSVMEATIAQELEREAAKAAAKARG